MFPLSFFTFLSNQSVARLFKLSDSSSILLTFLDLFMKIDTADVDNELFDRKIFLSVNLFCVNFYGDSFGRKMFLSVNPFCLFNRVEIYSYCFCIYSRLLR